MKVITVGSWDELAKYAKFEFAEGSYMRDVCKNCKQMNYPYIDFVQKYHAYYCPNCGEWCSVQFIFPDAAQVMSRNGVYTFTLYRN